MKTLIVGFGAVLMTLTVLPFVETVNQWVRFWDYPRQQITVGLVVVLLAFVLVVGVTGPTEVVFIAALAAALVVQLVLIYPYTFLSPVQMKAVRNPPHRDRLSIFVSNVLMTNRDGSGLLASIRELEPDIVLLLETDEWWDDQLSQLRDAYPHVRSLPLDNTFGLHFFAKVEVREVEVRHLVESDIPSVAADIELPNGERVMFYGLHPRPPHLQNSTAGRDAELLIVGREIRDAGRPAIVAGDLNDVAWSHTTRLFQRISGLLDPRIGRGIYATYNARIPLLSWPLDHVFASRHFALVGLNRPGSFGSDHFAVYAELAFATGRHSRDDVPGPEGDDLKQADERIKEGF